MKEDLLDAISERILLSDGAMGTELQRAGLESGGCGEAWNVDHPDRVLAIQQSYVEAGSDCLITNTFGGSAIMLARHGEADRMSEVNEAGARVAREALGDREGFVLGDIGPFGGLMEPYGEHGREEVLESFFNQAQALVNGGVDAIIIETQTVLEELDVAITAARDAGAKRVIASLAFDLTAETRELRTMMGTTPEDAATLMTDRGVDIFALNCGTGIDAAQAAEVVRRYREVSRQPVMAQPNAGQPVLREMKVYYDQTPAEMEEEFEAILAAGVRIIGGCCGTTPDHIRSLRSLLDRWEST